jgi:Tol biopolymer transport system component
MRSVRLLALAAATTAGLSLVIAQPSSATFPDHNGRIAFQAQVGDHVQLFTTRPDGSGLRQLTHDAGDSTRPDWSPNGRLIAFEFDRPDGSGCDVRLLRLESGRVVDLTSGTNVCEAAPAFTPDGKRIVFERYSAATNIDALWSMNVSGGDRHRIWVAPYGLTAPAVSPDGTMVSFVAFNGKDYGQALETIRMDGSHLSRLTPFWSDVAIKQDWAPDGRRLVFTDNADRLNRPANIFTIRPDGTGRRKLTHSASPQMRFYVGGYSPNGEWIVYRKENQDRYSLFRMHPDGSDKQRLLGPSTTFEPRFIDWGPATGDE